MNWRQRIIVDWPNDPQKSMRARDALKQIEDGLSTLSQLGHPLHLEEGYMPPPPPEWPKVVFHVYQGAKAVNNQQDLDELGPDWYATAEEARVALGMLKQQQRGGIFGRTLPSLFRRTQEDKDAAAEMARVANEAHKKFVNDQRAIFRERAANITEEKRNARSV